jgi:uncharacterized protein
MTPKTERFEMRLDPETLNRVDDWRSRQDDLPSRAEAIRRLVETGLSDSDSTEFQPNNTDKLILWMLASLLKQQKDEEGKERAELVKDAIHGGHFWALKWELPSVFHDHVDSKNALSLVVDTLEMWRCIEQAYASFSAVEKKRIETEVGPRAKNPNFMGFDGNNESEYMGIAQFMVEKLGRFESFKGRDFNSHMPMVGLYNRMVALFKPMRSSLIGRELSVEEVIELLRRE